MRDHNAPQRFARCKPTMGAELAIILIAAKLLDTINTVGGVRSAHAAI